MVCEWRGETSTHLHAVHIREHAYMVLMKRKIYILFAYTHHTCTCTHTHTHMHTHKHTHTHTHTHTLSHTHTLLTSLCKRRHISRVRTNMMVCPNFSHCGKIISLSTVILSGGVGTACVCVCVLGLCWGCVGIVLECVKHCCWCGWWVCGLWVSCMHPPAHHNTPTTTTQSNVMYSLKCQPFTVNSPHPIHSPHTPPPYHTILLDHIQ